MMPYIKKPKRKILEPNILAASGYVSCEGDLNYCFSLLCKQFIKRKGKKYKYFNACIGALESAKLELYRRHIAPYEDEKIKENGDI